VTTPVKSNPFTPMIRSISAPETFPSARAEMERIIAYANRGGLTQLERSALTASLKSKASEGKLSPQASAMVEKFLSGKGIAANGAGVGGLLDKAAADGKIDKAEIDKVIHDAQRFGMTGKEKAALSAALTDSKYKDAFEPGARTRLGEFVNRKPTGPVGDAATQRQVQVVAADGKIDQKELGALLASVKKDGVTDAERAALSDALAHRAKTMADDVRKRLSAFLAG